MNTNDIQNYRPEAVAKRLGVSKSTLWNYIKAGRIHTKKLSSRVTIIEAKELERFMTEEVASRPSQLQILLARI